MYSSRGFREWEIGDLDVVRRGRTYHLFHLVLPNHDYIAHAVSEDGMNWKRTRNALYTGEPGAWDDDMIWTMHVSRNPALGLYEMFYTGLHGAEKGYVQRIGRAVSRDLTHWRKDNEGQLPLEPREPHYEQAGAAGRGWFSFRDPFLFRRDDQEWLLFCARVPQGFVSRRGCVGLVRRRGSDYVLEAPLFFPRMYDDIECPCLVALEGVFYLIGSLREDVEVHYWWSEAFRGEYQSFRNHVLLPRGNYAARVMRDGDHVLVFNFFIDGLDVESGKRTLPPPKELRPGLHGGLELVSYYRWTEMQRGSRALGPGEFRAVLGNPAAGTAQEEDRLTVACRSGFELFMTAVEEPAWVWSGEVRVHHQGQCGLVFDLDDQINGYFISLDGTRGATQLRAWGTRPERMFRNYVYEDLQSATFPVEPGGPFRFRLIRWGSYIELSINGVVRLTLVDRRFKGRNLGIYAESAELTLSQQALHRLEEPGYDPQ
jgi:beta-fructofuranosidase